MTTYNLDDKQVELIIAALAQYSIFNVDKGEKLLSHSRLHPKYLFAVAERADKLRAWLEGRNLSLPAPIPAPAPMPATVKPEASNGPSGGTKIPVKPIPPRLPPNDALVPALDNGDSPLRGWNKVSGATEIEF